VGRHELALRAYGVRQTVRRIPMTTKRRVIAMSMGLMLLASVAPGVALAQDEIETFAAEETEWHLERLSMDGAMAEVPEAVGVTLFLRGGEASGNAGCNSYFGSYEITEATLAFPTPFGVTRVLCEGAAQTIEDAYLPLVQATAGWSVSEDGQLSLTNTEGVTTLVYGEVPLEITATDVDRLAVALSDLQTQIDTAEAQIGALSEQAASVNVSKLRNRISANEAAIAQIDTTVDKFRDRIKANEAAIVEINTTIDKFRDRIKANEAAIAEINTTIDKFRDRIKALEATAADHENRITQLEEAPPVPAPFEE
jgi:heat shock protein HslJ